MTRISHGAEPGKAFAILFLSLLLGSCSFAVKPIYFAEEQTVAEQSVTHFHQLYNAGNFEAIYELMREARTDDSRTITLSNIKLTFETVGKIGASRLGEHKVFPSSVNGYRTQVRLVYDSESEKGKWIEFFTWHIKNNHQAVLLDYQVVPNTTGDPVLRSQAQLGSENNKSPRHRIY